MKTIVILFFLSIFGVSVRSIAVPPPSITNRADGLKIKAKMDYEKKTQPSEAPAVNLESKSEKPTTIVPAEQSGMAVRSVNAPVRSDSSKNLTCKNGKDVRQLLLEYKGAGCDLVYVKGSQSKSQAHQNTASTICESVYEKMKATLEKTGFACESK